MFKYIFFFFLSIIFANANDLVPYDLKKPSRKITLPADLNEVSGITVISSDLIALNQDEDGIVYFYNPQTNSLTNKISFQSKGDFEDIALAENSIFILRSDGELTEIQNFKENTSSIIIYNLKLATVDNEGLCYDKGKMRLLIAGKSKPKKDKDERFIYSFDLKTRKLETQPVFKINLHEMHKFAKENYHGKKGSSKKSKFKVEDFRPSGIAINPLDKSIYIISAEDKLLLCINQRGEIEEIKHLKYKHFIQPEGIAFLQDGTLLITNEAAGKKPTLLFFNPSPER